MKRLWALLLLLGLSGCGSYKVPFSLSITPNNTTVAPYAQVQFTVYQNVEDGSAIDVTAQAQIKSSNTKLLQFSTAPKTHGLGLASGYGGTVRISAVFQGHSTATALTITPAATVNAWGDNLTAGTGATAGKTDYVSQLGALLARSVANFGIAGQKSTPIAMRQGGVATMLSLQDNLLPAGGSAASVTAINGQALAGMATAEDPDYRLLSSPSSLTQVNLTGTVGGFHGTLSRIGSGGGGHPSTLETYTFTQDSGAAEQGLAGPAPFVPDTQQTLDGVAIFWMGRNNYTQPAQVLQDIAAAVAYLGNRRFFVLSVLNAEGEGQGTAAYAAITQLNSQLAAAYGTSYIDIRGTLVAAYDPKNTKDVQDHANDIPPSSLRADSLDLNSAGYALVAQTLAGAIDANNW